MKKPDKKYMIVVNALKKAIEDGTLPAGMKLPGQNLLGIPYGVSPITSKRALSELKKMGYIDCRHRSGSYVRAKPRLFSEINIVIGGKIKNEGLWLSDYWKGIEQEAARLGIPSQVMRTSAPGFVERVPEGSENQGVVLLGFEDLALIERLRERNIAHTVGVIEAHHVPYNVLVNYRRAVFELAETMANSAGCRNFYFLANLQQPSHRLARDGFNAFIDDFSGTGKILNVDEDSIQDVMKTLLNSQEIVDGVIIMGGVLPFRALPLLLQSTRNIKLGVLTENQTIRQLNGTAFIAEYSLFECGKLLFQLLYESAANRNLPATTRYPRLTIIKP